MTPDASKFGDVAQYLPVACTEGIEFLLGLPAKKEEGEGKWSAEPWECYKDPMICLATLCCPCVGARNASYIEGKSCEGMCLSNCCICCLGWCYGAKVRGDLRKKHGIKGSNQEDCIFMSPCLACCTAIQTTYEIQTKLGGGGGVEAMKASAQAMKAPKTETMDGQGKPADEAAATPAAAATSE
eukprot:gb/GEZN01012713.1/.p1 GENE.gb/GEZN01012713.1/~~gb/GEZN01012713.1/.p1  ORF type:complete len:208 (+),score=24.72 gb/GEZN01012713.1/:74-625(+)